MRISSQNNHFIFNLPESFISRILEEQFQKLMDKNLIPFENCISYLNSTIKDIVFPSLSFDNVEQLSRYGKKRIFKEAGNILDKFQNEIDITFISVDSHLNYMMLLQMITNFYLLPDPYIDVIEIKILDKDGDLVYTVVLRDVLISNLSECRFAYYHTEFSEQTFTMTVKYNYIDIIWDIESDGRTIFDISDQIDEGDPRDMRKLIDAKNKRMLQ